MTLRHSLDICQAPEYCRRKSLTKLCVWCVSVWEMAVLIGIMMYHVNLRTDCQNCYDNCGSIFRPKPRKTKDRGHTRPKRQVLVVLCVKLGYKLSGMEWALFTCQLALINLVLAKIAHWVENLVAGTAAVLLVLLLPLVSFPRRAPPPPRQTPVLGILTHRVGGTLAICGGKQRKNSVPWSLLGAASTGTTAASVRLLAKSHGSIKLDQILSMTIWIGLKLYTAMAFS